MKLINDGANKQAQAVLCYFEPEREFLFKDGRYQEYRLGRFENCREQGYTLSLTKKFPECLNISFFEHRNSDSIVAIKYMGQFMNSPTVDEAIKAGAWAGGKFDTDHSVKYGQAEEMAQWIEDQFEEFYTKDSDAE